MDLVISKKIDIFGIQRKFNNRKHMKNLSTKEFANECVKHMISLDWGVKALKWKIKDEDFSSFNDMYDLFNDLNCDKEYEDEFMRRFRTKSMVDGKFTEHPSLENFNEFLAAFLDTAKEMVK